MKIISYIIGIGVLITGIFGFFGNPFGLLETGTIQNIIYVIFGLLILMAVKKGKAMLPKIIGIIFAILGILGLIMSGDSVLGIVQNSGGGNWFHLIVGIILIVIAFMQHKGSSHGSSMNSGGMNNQQMPQQPETPQQPNNPQM